MGIHLTPLASLCLGVVRGWINVARKGRGGQIDEEGTAWTRLPAEQLRDQLEREFLVDVSTRSIQRALKELEEAQQIRREQRWKHRYKRDYWYAMPEHEEALEEQRPRTIASRFKSERPNQRTHNEASGTTVQVLSTQIKNTQILNPQTKNQKPERKNTISVAIDACMKRAKKASKGFGVYSENLIQGRKEISVGIDRQGRTLKEVWVAGTKHLVVD